MVMGLDGIVQIRCGHKPSSAHADYFWRKALLRVMICQVLDHPIGINHVEASIPKGQRTTIEDQCLSHQESHAANPVLRIRNAAAVTW
jgi:hypothetical protein